jgi:hypothetical protein
MIDIKQAVNAAIQYLVRLYDDPPGVQLEEVFKSDNGLYWLVTLSFLAPLNQEEALSGEGMYARFQNEMLGKRHFVRKYKSLEVDGNSAEVRSMKIRPVPSV